MYKILYPENDATIYEGYPNRNTGIDQILEISKFTQGEFRRDTDFKKSSWERNYNSRILLKFNLDGVFEYFDNNAEVMNSLSAKLFLYTAHAESLNDQYTLVAHPMLRDWKNGSGNFNDLPEITNGVNWRTFNGVDSWDLTVGESYYTSVTGGGTWNEASSSQTFRIGSPDLSMDVTDIVVGWIENEYDNNGLIIKHTNDAESDNDIYGRLKFFGRETHTIFVPKLILFWDESENIDSGSMNAINNDYIIHLSNLKSVYKPNEISKLRVFVRDRYRNVNRFNNGENVNILNGNLYYSITDSVTGTDVLPYHEIGTKVKLDENGYYMNMDLNNYMPNRYYTIRFKYIHNGFEEVYNSDFNFRVER